MDVSSAFAVVFSDDGGRHKVCRTQGDVTAAVNQLAAAGITPVVFYRRSNGTQNVVNVAPEGFSGVQAGVINGGVRMG